jgi:ankyrin repeat protein
VARLLAEPGVDADAAADITDVDGDTTNFTPLTSAAELGHLETARLLLQAGANPSRADGEGATRARSHCRFASPLIHFTPELLTYSVPLFLKRQCDRTLGDTPQMVAAANGHLELLRLLLAWGAAVDAADPATGWTAFHMACYHNQARAIVIAPLYMENLYRSSCASFSLRYGGQAECAEALARVGCDVGLKTKGRGQMGERGSGFGMGVRVGLGRIVDVYCRSFTSYHNR